MPRVGRSLAKQSLAESSFGYEGPNVLNLTSTILGDFAYTPARFCLAMSYGPSHVTVHWAHKRDSASRDSSKGHVMSQVISASDSSCIRRRRVSGEAMDTSPGGPRSRKPSAGSLPSGAGGGHPRVSRCRSSATTIRLLGGPFLPSAQP
jgi:hypothetical protein